MVYKILGWVPASKVRAQNWGSYTSDDLVARRRANPLKERPCHTVSTFRFLKEDYFFPMPEPTYKNCRFFVSP